MKKLMLLFAAAIFVFASCGNKGTEEPTVDSTAVDTTVVAEEDCCKQECCKIHAAWEDWDNQTPEMKAELVAKKLEMAKAFLAEECECPEMQAKKAEFAKLLETIDVNDVEKAKEILDQCPCHPKCQKDAACKCEKDCAPDCCKDNCKCAEGKEECKK